MSLVPFYGGGHLRWASDPPGEDWFLLGAVEVPATSDKSFDYQVLVGLMKVL